MKKIKNKLMISFVIVISAITYFGTLFTADCGVKVEDNHNTQYQSNM